MTEPLRLSAERPFATGGRRLCFVHPLDPARCVKVLRTDDARFVKTGRTLVPAALRREYDNNEDERRALAALERRLSSADYRHLPRCYGYEPTDLGRGLVLDLVRDEPADEAPGPIARSVRQVLAEGVPLEDLRAAYDAMGEHFIRCGVTTRAILDHNLAAQRRGAGWNLVLIDGFGERAWIPIRSMIPAVRRRSAQRRVERGWRRLEATAREVRAGADWDRSRWGQGFLEHRGAEPGDAASR